MKNSDDILTLDLKRRASRYLSYLKLQKVKGRVFISTDDLALPLGFKYQDVTSDLCLLGVYSTSESYNISTIIDCIESNFPTHCFKEAFLICSGKLVQAGAVVAELNKSGIKVVAAFDPTSPSEPYDIEGINVLSLDRMSNLANRMHINLIVIAVDDKHIEGSMAAAAAARVKAILNASSAQASPPPSGAFVQKNDGEELSSTINRLLFILKDKS